VASTTVSPEVTTAAPGRLLAIRPVSNCSRLPPASSTETPVSYFPQFLYRNSRRAPQADGRMGSGKSRGLPDLACCAPIENPPLWRDGVALNCPCSFGSRRSRAEGRASLLFANAPVCQITGPGNAPDRGSSDNPARAAALAHQQSANRGAKHESFTWVLNARSGRQIRSLSTRNLPLPASCIGIVSAIARDKLRLSFGCQHLCA